MPGKILFTKRFTRRDIIKALGNALGLGVIGVNANLGCGDLIGDTLYNYCIQNLPKECEDSENVTRNSGGIEINAPERSQEDIASHLIFLQEFSGENAVNLTRNITIYDPNRESCACDNHPEINGDHASEDIGGYTDGSGNIYVRSESIIRNEHYWPSRFHLPYIMAAFAEHGGEAFVLSHELWHNISAQLSGRESICKLYNEEGVDCSDFDEILANSYGTFVMAAYLIRLNMPSSPVFEQFILPSLNAGEVTKDRVFELMNGFALIPVCDTQQCHEKYLSMFIELGAINPQFEESLSYDDIYDAFMNMYARWYDHAHNVLSDM